MARLPDTAWWYWAAMALLLAGKAVLPAAALAATGLGVVQWVHFYARSERMGALPVQVRAAFLGFLVAGLWTPLGFIHWLMLGATLARVAFDYCLLARTLALMPWNHSQPLSLRLVQQVYLTPPTQDSILAALARPVRAADAPLVQQLVRELSPQSRRNCFFGPVSELTPAQLARMTRFDGTTALGLVAVAGGDSPRIVGIAQHAVSDPPFVELAVVVADDWQRQGLGERLVALLLAHAGRTGVAAVQGFVMAANRPMLALASKLGFALEDDADPDLVRIEKPLGRVSGFAA